MHTCTCLHLVVPDSVVVGCQGSEATGARPSEIALRLHFEAEHSNVLIVTAELLNGCLAQVEVHSMSMALILDGNPHHPVSGVDCIQCKQAVVHLSSKHTLCGSR